jgi:hypothetical protein
MRTFVAYLAQGSLLHGGWVEYAAEVDWWLDHASVHGIETLSYSIVALRRASSFHCCGGQFSRRRALPKPVPNT